MTARIRTMLSRGWHRSIAFRGSQSEPGRVVMNELWDAGLEGR